MKQNKTENDTIKKNIDQDCPVITETVVCKLEVDLIRWLADLSGKDCWEVYSDNEFQHYSTFCLREGDEEAEVTLFKGGFAQVDLNGKSIFYGDLLKGPINNVRMSYFTADSGNKIMMQ